MKPFQSSKQPVAYTLRVLAHLISYPDETIRNHLPEMRDALHREHVLNQARMVELDRFIDTLIKQPALDTESIYVELFDRGRGTALHLFEHIHGDSRDRGPAMIDLAQTYEKAGLYLQDGELPDYLPVALQYASTQPPAQARAFLNEIAHILRVIFSALVKRDSAYASVLAALIELAGEKAEAVSVPAEPELDETWAEPAAFDGCATQGQAKPDQPQPIQIVRRKPTDGQPLGVRA